MANQEFVVESAHTTAVSEQLMQEIEKMPPEYLPNLLQLVRLFRESVTLKPAEANFRQGWQEATTGQTQPVTEGNAWDVLEAMTEETLPVSQQWEKIYKNYVLDENQQPIAVQIPIAEFQRIEEILEDFGLARLMAQTEQEDNKRLSKDEALKYYQALKGENVDSRIH